MKNKLAVGLVLIVVVVVGIAATQQSKDIPPGVPAERWIALNDSLGFVVGEVQPDWETGKTNWIFQTPNGPVPQEREIMVPGNTGWADAFLMAKVQGRWCRLYLPPAPSRTHLLR